MDALLVLTRGSSVVFVHILVFRARTHYAQYTGEVTLKAMANVVWCYASRLCTWGASGSTYYLTRQADSEIRMNTGGVLMFGGVWCC